MIVEGTQKSNRMLLYFLVGAAIVGMLAFVGMGVAAYFFFQRWTGISFTRPAELSKPAVLVGDELLQKTVDVRDDSFGTATDFLLQPTPDVRLAIAGTQGAVFLRANGTVQSQVRFPEGADHVDFVDVEGDGKWEYLNRGGEGWSDASLLDATGHTLWTHGGMPGLDDMVAGDLNGDGTADFVAGFNGGGGVRGVDKNGTVQWQKPDSNVWHVEIVDTDGNGKPEIIHSNAGGQMTVRDANGSALRVFPVATYCSHFSLCHWPTAASPPVLLTVDDGSIWLFGLTGKTVLQLDAPHSGRLGRAYGTPVRLRPGESESLAVVVDYNHWDVSVLYVYSPDRKLIYQEVLPSRSESILAVPNKAGDADELLVGGTGVVWKYVASPAEENIDRSEN